MLTILVAVSDNYIAQNKKRNLFESETTMSLENNENELQNINDPEEPILEIPYSESEAFGDQSYGTGSHQEDPANTVIPNSKKRSRFDFKFGASSKNLVFAVIALLGIIIVFGIAMLCDRKGANPRAFFS